MKLQSLSIIFIIIIMPITIVLSEYISNLIESRETEMTYDTKLLDSTYDAVKAYQLNTVNNAFGDVTTQRVKDVEAAAKTFMNSLVSSFNYSGYDSKVMQEYVSAIVFTMYDGYYIYSPFTNTMTNVKTLDEDDTSYDSSYSTPGETKDGLKPYVYYNCRYKIDSDGSDFVITYTLDNYITIQGIIKGQYVYDCGYVYSVSDTETDDAIYYNERTNEYKYNKISFTENDTEELKEYIGNKEYSYAKINGKKYYLDPKYYGEVNSSGIRITYEGRSIDIPKDDLNAGIFYIDETGAKNYNQTQGYSPTHLRKQNEEFIKYYLAIKYNKSAYEYFRNAYRFSKMVLGGGISEEEYTDKTGSVFSKSGGYGLEDLKTSDAVIYGTESGDTSDIYNNLSKDIMNISEYGEFNIFDNKVGRADSKFEQHRKAIIRYVIETNLATSINSFSSLVSDVDFIMPKISEENWEIIQNDVCAISFLQGLSIGTEQYNGYAVVANNKTTEKIGEKDIYILAKDAKGNNIYCMPNDRKLVAGYNIIDKGEGEIPTYYGGIWKLNFEMKQDATDSIETYIYQPMCYTIYDADGNPQRL